MPFYKTIIAIQAPPGIDLQRALPFLERSGVVELPTSSVAYLDAGPEFHEKRLKRKLLFLRATLQALLNTAIRLGASASKSVSIIAARQSAPGGITMVRPGTEKRFLEGMVIDLLPGIGRRTATYLRHRGVTTIGKFSQLPQTAAVQLFGISGIVLREFSQGADPREVLPQRPRRPHLKGRRSLLTLFARENPPRSLRPAPLFGLR